MLNHRRRKYNGLKSTGKQKTCPLKQQRKKIHNNLYTQRYTHTQPITIGFPCHPEFLIKVVKSRINNRQSRFSSKFYAWWCFFVRSLFSRNERVSFNFRSHKSFATFCEGHFFGVRLVITFTLGDIRCLLYTSFVCILFRVILRHIIFRFRPVFALVISIRNT